MFSNLSLGYLYDHNLNQIFIEFNERVSKCMHLNDAFIGNKLFEVSMKQPAYL